MCLAPVAWIPEKTRMEVTSVWSQGAGRSAGRGGLEQDSATPAGPRPASAGSEIHAQRIEQKSSLHWGNGSDVPHLVARLLAGAPGAPAARVAGRRDRRGGGRAPEREPAARLRGRGAEPPRGAGARLGRPGVPVAGG